MLKLRYIGIAYLLFNLLGFSLQNEEETHEIVEEDDNDFNPILIKDELLYIFEISSHGLNYPLTNYSGLWPKEKSS